MMYTRIAFLKKSHVQKVLIPEHEIYNSTFVYWVRTTGPAPLPRPIWCHPSQPQLQAGSSVTSAVSENPWFVQRSYREGVQQHPALEEIRNTRCQCPNGRFLHEALRRMKRALKLGKLRLQEIRSQIQNSLFYSIDRTYTVLYFKHWAMFKCTWSILWFERYLSILSSVHWVCLAPGAWGEGGRGGGLVSGVC